MSAFVACRFVKFLSYILQVLCRATFPYVHDPVGIEFFLSLAWPVGPVFFHWAIIPKLTGKRNGILHQSMPANGQSKQEEAQSLHGILLQTPQNGNQEW